jgi:HK97 family phage prohead protease
MSAFGRLTGSGIIAPYWQRSTAERGCLIEAIHPGAFTRALEAARSTPIRFELDHDDAQVFGQWPDQRGRFELYEDASGLRYEIDLRGDDLDNPAARRLCEAVRAGRFRGCSTGYPLGSRVTGLFGETRLVRAVPRLNEVSFLIGLMTPHFDTRAACHLVAY